MAAAARQDGASLMVKAYAGTAKTTTLTMAAQGIRVPGLALAFNKSIANELKGKLPANFETKTLNGLGHGAWIRALPQGTKIEIDERKLGKLVSQEAKSSKMDLTTDQWDSVRKLVSGAMLAGITPGDEGMPLALDTRAGWEAVADELLLSNEEFDLLWELARRVLTQSVTMAKRGLISFDDQVYASVCLGGKFPQFPMVMVDEAQDLSPLNHAMLTKVGRKGGRFLVCGDPRQAIYAFRGASTESMDLMRPLSPDWGDFALTLTFRCPRSVVARQQSHAPGFRAAPGNAEGRVTRLGVTPDFATDGPEVDGWLWKDLLEAAWPGSRQLAVLCRNNAPLLKLAFLLLRNNVGVKMLGTDIGRGLVALSRGLAPDNATPRDIAEGKIRDWIQAESSKALTEDKPAKAAGIMDRGQCLLAVFSGAGASTAGDLRLALAKLFDRVDGTVVLSSIHRAKGLEWDTVVMLDPWRIPSVFAKKAALRGDERQLQQEYNLRYVGETRTRQHLVLADAEGFQFDVAAQPPDTSHQHQEQAE